MRSIAVPAEKVYDAFIDPEQIVRWMAPESYDVSRAEVDPRIGGAADVWYGEEGGEQRRFHWEFVEMVPARRLVFSFAFGGPGDDLPTDRSQLTLEFREVGPEATELTLVHERLGSDIPGGAAAVTGGWTQVTGRLVDYLESTKGA